MKRKIFVLDPDSRDSISEFQDLLNKAWIPVMVNEQHVSAASGNQYSSYAVKGKIIYILEQR